MPRRRPSVCARPGCPFLTDPGKSRCDRPECSPDRNRGTAAERGYDRRWQTFRADFLARPENTFCSEEYCLALATDVDHIDGQGPLGPRGFDRTNCRGFCHSHHSRRTARDNGSFGRWA